jgi:hypothetical protein
MVMRPCAEIREIAAWSHPGISSTAMAVMRCGAGRVDLGVQLPRDHREAFGCALVDRVLGRLHTNRS